MKTLSTRNIAILAAVLLIVDQASKVWIKTNMTINQSYHILGDWFQIRFIENNGAAYGMELGGDYGKLALSLFRIVAVCALAWYVGKINHSRAPKGVVIGFVMILAGAVGNIIDSAVYGMIFSESTFSQVATLVPWGEGYQTFLHGAVVDMLYFPIINTVLPEWVPFWGGEPYIFFSPIFNIADSYISVGFIYMLIFHRKFFK